MHNSRNRIGLLGLAAGLLMSGLAALGGSQPAAPAPDFNPDRRTRFRNRPYTIRNRPYTSSSHHLAEKFKACAGGCRPPARRHYKPIGRASRSS